MGGGSGDAWRRCGGGGQADEEADIEAWKGREMARIARDREEKRREAAEAEERERLKHMTEDERRQWERDHPKARPMPPARRPERRNLRLVMPLYGVPPDSGDSRRAGAPAARGLFEF